jgi:hypothetical protein
MILVRMVFRAKWDKMGDVVSNMKKGSAIIHRITNGRVRVLTDLSGPFNTLVEEIEVESLAAWEQLRVKIFTDPEFQQLQDMVESPFESGSIEFYTIEETLG